MKIRRFYALITLAIIWGGIACKDEGDTQHAKIDFSKRVQINDISKGAIPPLMAAVSARMSPEENFYYYNRFFEYLSSQLGRRIQFRQRKTYGEVNDLLQSGDLDFAFICSGAYIEAKRTFNAEILAVPQMKGQTIYFAYIIVHNDSGIKSFDDLKGGKFAFTDPLSNTGCLYPRYLVTKYGHSIDDFFHDVIYTYSHDNSIQAIESNLVDGASVDSLIFDQIKANHPEKVSHVKVIQKSGPFGILPLVVHADLDPEIKEKIREVLFGMNQNKSGKEILSQLEIDRFVRGSDKEYDSIRRMQSFLNKPDYDN
jgi:phosphonate transport system substrate-binding protein